MLLSQRPDAFRARSIPVPLQVEFAAADGSIETLEGAVRYQTGDAIVTGVKGERWPIPRQRFEASYEPVPPTRMGQDGVYRKRPREVWAFELTAPIEVVLPENRGTLKGQAGDVLVEYAPGDQAIVAADVFWRTYERLAGPPAA